MSVLEQAFADERGRLHALAHRVVGSHADADDVVQEAWIRLSRQDPAGIVNLGGWLTTVVSRVSLDVLRSRQARPTVSYDDPSTGSVGPDRSGAGDPEDGVVTADAVAEALAVVLDSLSPDERLTLVLHDAFAVPYADIAAILGKSTAATKMLGSRARRRTREAPRPARSTDDQRAVVQAFLTAARHGDFAGLLDVLHPDVQLVTRTSTGAVVTLGATEVAARAQFAARTARAERADVDGHPGVVSRDEDGTVVSILSFTVLEGRITRITALVDPAELARLDLPPRPPP